MQIQTEIIINASAQRVWDILTDFENYQNWNPFIVHSQGKAVAGQKLQNTMRLNGKDQVFKPTLLKVEPIRYVEWLGSLFFKGLFDGRHFFELVPIDENQVKLIHGESFGGGFKRLIMSQVGDETRENFIKMNQALKQEAEKK